ncbi:MAG: AbrB/MazE/SpoVT family DNA-binding domain-containing protein [Nitrososphaerales archaeon]
MPTESKIKITKIGNSLRVVIPKPATDGLGWKEGDVLKLTVVGSHVVLKKS